MKASEAIKILEALDPSHEVTLTIGSPKQYKFPQNPKWDSPQPMWVKTNEWPLPFNHITCKTVH